MFRLHSLFAFQPERRAVQRYAGALQHAFHFALQGLGAHVPTVNSYLARREFDFAGPAFGRLGLTVGLLPEKQEHAKKRAAYASDVTYGVGTEFGFDYLRDQLAWRA